MHAEFRPPRRRPRVYEEYQAPLPVNRNVEKTIHFRADLINQHVLVRDPDHIQSIYNQGFFGKGIFSRAQPDHSLFSQREEHEGHFLPVVSESRYEELLRWARQALSAQGLDEETVSQRLLRLAEPVTLEEMRREMGPGENGHMGKGEDREGVETAPEGGVSSSLEESEMEIDCKNRAQDLSPKPDPESDSNPEPDSSSDQDSDPDCGLVVPGQGFVLVHGGLRQIRRVPFSLTEYLQLSLEEAFFLVYSLGCLSVYLNQEPLSVIQLWQMFRSLRPDFISFYSAYHYFRSKGWVPKGGGGAKYGVDFMLYRKGPPFYHSSYSVVVERAGDAFRGSALRPFSWRSLAALSRITANVSKELMLCYVIHPTDLSEAEMDSPECLSRLTVQEVIVSRWVSSKERAEQDDI